MSRTRPLTARRDQAVARTTAAALAGTLALGAALVATAPSAPATPFAPVAPAARTSDPPNLALTGTATASSVEQDLDRLAPRFVNDGDPATRWSSSYDDDNWVQVELAEPSPVDHVSVSWPGACAADYVVQTSVDGATWTDRERVTRSDCWRTDVVSLGVTDPVGFVRLQGLERASRWGYSIYELEIYASPRAGREGPALVPRPAAMSRPDGVEDFVLDATSAVVADGEGAAGVARYLAEGLRPATGYDLPVVDTAPERDGGDVVVDVAPGNVAAEHATEGYALRVTPDAVTIAADTVAGARLGVQTLRQLLPSWIESPEPVDVAWTIPAVQITDHPRFDYRGIMLDPARSFLTVDEVEHVIDGAARLKLNVLHLHLTDDQGWRIAIDQPTDSPSGIDYRRLTEVSGKTAVYSNDGTTVLGSEPGITGFYTQDDYTRIVRYAARNGMTVVPEIDLPGHINAALHAVPQLNSAGSAPKPLEGEDTAPVNRTTSVGESTLDADNPATYEFLETVLTQIAELTPGPYVHIGGDEAFTTTHEDYLRIVDFATDLVTDLGKTPIGWNEAASSALPEGSVVQYWNGGAGPVADAVATKGARVVLSPANKAYLPQKQDARMPIGATWACGGPCGLQQFYEWDPGAFLAGVDQSAVEGVEAPLWSEWVRRGDEAEYLIFPRLLATAEVGWSPQAGKPDYAEFAARVGAFGGRMTLADQAFFPTAEVPWVVDAAGRAATTAAGSAAQVEWTVTAPDLTADDLNAVVEWSDGSSEPVSLAGSITADIAKLRINDELRGRSQHVFAEPGTHTATLRVSRPGWADVVREVPVTVVDAGGVGVAADARCVGDAAFVGVRATNTGDDPVRVTIESAYGARTFERVAPARNAYAAFPVRAPAVGAGEATVVADGVAHTAPYEGVACS